MSQRRIAILGSTGSIGRQTLEVLRALPGYAPCALAGGGNWQLLAEQVREFRPPLVALADEQHADALRRAVPRDVKLLVGPHAMTDMVRLAECDILLSGVVGSAGLEATLVGIERGARLAIANKETLVMAGAIVMPAARAAHVPVLPVDSEHSAIFQCLAAGKRSEVRRVVLTASGGALRDWDPASAHAATVDDALAHPTWSMGRKITIDSATLVNKALEVVEAHWLFDLPPEQIGVVVHPQSVVHSYVEFCDGSVIAQMGLPDMMTPIAYALCYPDRPCRDVPPLDLARVGALTFRPLEGRFAAAVELGYDAIRRGGTAGAVLNSANESAVAAFLDGAIPFGRIVELVADTMNQAPPTGEVTLDALQAADRWARRRVREAIDPPTE